MMDAVIISSLSQRYYYDAFVEECKKLGVRVGILDPELFVTEDHLMDIHFDTSGLRASVEVVELGRDSNVTKLIDVQSLKVAWYLRVDRTVRVSGIENTEKRFKWSETLCALDSLFSALPCKWINTFEVIDRLNCNKLLQQMHAARAGLKTPMTVLSNSPESVLAFCESCGSKSLFKSIGYTHLDLNNEMVLYSEVFDYSELRESEGAVRSCPVFAQEYIPKLYEYRVMVIGEEVHACRIDSQASMKTLIDWRHYDFENVAHTSYQLPEEVSVRLLAFMRSIGLTYGAIDMIETPEGDFVFLEVNPSGQWHWIAELADLPIAESVARMLKQYVP